MYGSLHVRGYIPTTKRMMKSIDNNLRCPADAPHVPCYVVQMTYNLYPGPDYIPSMIQPLDSPRQGHC